MSRPRPGERPTAVAEAEALAFGGTDAETPRPFPELVRCAATVSTSGWWIEAGGPTVTVSRARSTARSSRARSRAAPGPIAVMLAAGQLDLATIIHELAHALAGLAHGHDARFRTAAVDVATVVLGDRPGRALAGAFATFGLLWDPRPWPPPWQLSGPGFRMGIAVDAGGEDHPQG